MHTNLAPKFSWVCAKSWECGYVGACMLASVYVCGCHVWLATTVSETFIPQRPLSGSGLLLPSHTLTLQRLFLQSLQHDYHLQSNL